MSDVHSATTVIPCDGHVQEESAGPVSGDFMDCLQGGKEVARIGAVRVLDAKVINNQTNVNVMGRVGPQAGSMSTVSITVSPYVSLFVHERRRRLAGDHTCRERFQKGQHIFELGPNDDIGQ
jgi:hypothetical protein